MIHVHQGSKPEHCEECGEKTPHRIIFKGMGTEHYRPAKAVCMKCETTIEYGKSSKVDQHS